MSERTWAEARLQMLDERLRLHGVFLRGGFHPEPGEDMPGLSDGSPAGTVVLAGNAGPDLWRAFVAAKPDWDRPHPLDEWLDGVLSEAGAVIGADALFPSRGPPFTPLSSWAMRGEPVYPSPIGLMIHPDFGLWHAYRAVFLFADYLVLPPSDLRPIPCETCADRPCLQACPVEAHGAGGYQAVTCYGHVASTAGKACRTEGCAARRACPVGQDYIYPLEARAFHTDFALRAARDPSAFQSR